MSDPHSLLERADRAASRVPLPDGGLERILRRRDRKRRNQRIMAGAVGIAVFATVMSVLMGLGSAGHTQVDVGRSGAVPSAPQEGEVVAQFNEPYEGEPSAPQFLYVYADGRVLAWGWGSDFLTERRLTPEGVELVRSGSIEAADLTPSSSGVPLDIWRDPQIKPFVPSRYAVCYSLDLAEGAPQTQGYDGYELPSRVVGFFPAPARAILEGELTRGTVGDPDSSDPVCSAVTTDEVRVLEDILSDVTVRNSEGIEIFWDIDMVLPHGVHIGHCSPGSCG